MVGKKEKGFTLIEVMITVVIVAVGLLATAQLLIMTIKQNGNSELRIDSSAAVQVMLYDAEAIMLAADTPVDKCTALSANVDAKSYLGVGYVETLTCEELGSNLQQFRISAKVERAGGQVLAQRDTVITTVVSAK